MAKGLVLLLCDEHDLPSLINRMPAESIYVETEVTTDECGWDPQTFLEAVVAPMMARLRQTEEWPRG